MRIKLFYTFIIFLLISCAKDRDNLKYPTRTIQSQFNSYCKCIENSPKELLTEFNKSYLEFKKSQAEENKHNVMVALDKMKRLIEYELFASGDRVFLTISIASDKNYYDVYHAKNNTVSDSLSKARDRFSFQCLNYIQRRTESVIHLLFNLK